MEIQSLKLFVTEAEANELMKKHAPNTDPVEKLVLVSRRRA